MGHYHAYKDIYGLTFRLRGVGKYFLLQATLKLLDIFMGLVLRRDGLFAIVSDSFIYSKFSLVIYGV